MRVPRWSATLAATAVAAMVLLQPTPDVAAQPATDVAAQSRSADRVLETVTATLGPDGRAEEARVQQRVEQHAPATSSRSTAAEMPIDELPVTVVLRYVLDGRPVDPAELRGRSGEVVVHIQLRNTSAAPRTIRYDTAEGETTETVPVPLPLRAETVLTFDDGWHGLTTEQAAVSAGIDGGTELRWSTALFEPFGDTVAELRVRGHLDGGGPPRLEVAATPTRVSASELLRRLDDELSDRATLDAVVAAAAAGLRDAVQELAAGAAQLAAGIDELGDELGAALAGLDDLDPDELLGEALEDLAQQLEPDQLLAGLLPPGAFAPTDLLEDLPDAELDLGDQLADAVDPATLGTLLPRPELDLGALLADLPAPALDLDDALGPLAELADPTIDAERLVAALPTPDVAALLDELDVEAALPDAGTLLLVADALRHAAATLDALEDAIPDVPAPADPGDDGGELAAFVADLAARLTAAADATADAPLPTLDAIVERLTDARERLDEAAEALDAAIGDEDDGTAARLVPVADALAAVGATIDAAHRHAERLHDELHGALADAAATLADAAAELGRLAERWPAATPDLPAPPDLADLDELRSRLLDLAAEIETLATHLDTDPAGTLRDLVDDALGELDGATVVRALGLDQALPAVLDAVDLPTVDELGAAIGAAVDEALDDLLTGAEAAVDALLDDLTPDLDELGPALADALAGPLETAVSQAIEQALTDVAAAVPDPAELLDDLALPAGPELLDALGIDPAALADELGLEQLDDLDGAVGEVVGATDALAEGAGGIEDGLGLVADDGLTELVAQLDADNREAQRDLALLAAVDDRAGDARTSVTPAGHDAEVRYLLVHDPDEPLTPVAVTLAVVAAIALAAEALRRRWTGSAGAGGG